MATEKKDASRKGLTATRPRDRNGVSAALARRGEKPETLLGYYRQMLLIRRFEERTGEMYTRAKIGGYCHLNLGEEATIVGLMAALEPRDYKKACAYQMAAERVDGNDVLAVREAARKAVKRAREEQLPTLLEALS